MGRLDDLKTRSQRIEDGAIGIDDELSDDQFTAADSGSGTGTGAGTSTANDGGTTKRGRGRPRGSGAASAGTRASSDNSETQYILDDDEQKPRQTRRRKQSDIVSSDDVAKTIKLGCDMLAALRGAHWNKKQNDILPLAIPLSEYINNMPVNMRKKAQAYVLPITLAMGAVAVFGEPVSVEYEIISAQLASRKRPFGARNVASNNDARQGQNGVSAGNRNGSSTPDGFAVNRQFGFPISND